MPRSALEGLLITERKRQQVPLDPTHGDFSIPAFRERDVEREAEPFLATNMRGTFVEVARSKTRGTVRHSFSECPLDQEGALVAELYRVLSERPWAVRCNTIAEATSRILEPRSLVVPFTLLEKACGESVSVEDAEKMMMLQGHVTEVSGMRVMMAPLPDDAALVAAAPPLLGFYTRIGDWLGLLLQGLDRTMVVVHGLA